MPPISPQPMIARLREHVPIALVGEDPEGVHQVRVASQRLRVWCRLARNKAIRRELAWLRACAGEHRDIDVFLLSAPPEPLASWLVDRRAQLRPDLEQALTSERLESLLASLDGLTPLGQRTARKGLVRIAAKTLGKGEAAETDPHSERLHDLRRAVRQTRYALEWLGEPPAGVKAVQSALGRYNDLVVQDVLIERSRLAGELGPWAATLARSRAESALAARRAWAIHRHLFKGLVG